MIFVLLKLNVIFRILILSSDNNFLFKIMIKLVHNIIYLFIYYIAKICITNNIINGV